MAYCRLRSRSARDRPQNLAGRKSRRKGRPHCYCSSPSGLPTNCGAPFSTLPEYTGFIVQLRAPACSPACIPSPFSHCTQYIVSPFTFVLQRADLPAFHSHFLTAHNTGSPFTFVLQHAHLPAFHSHFLTAHNTGSVFLKKFLWITFSSVFLTAHNIGTVFLKKIL